MMKKNLLFALLILPTVLCGHEHIYKEELSTEDIMPMIVGRLSKYNFDFSLVGSPEKCETNIDHHTHELSINEAIQANANIDVEIKTAFEGTGSSKIINHILNQTIPATSVRKGSLTKTAYFKTCSGTEHGKFTFKLSVDKDLKVENKSIAINKQKLRSCEFTLKKCGIEELRNEFIHVNFDDVSGPFAIKGLVKAEIGKSVSTPDCGISYNRESLSTVLIVGLSEQAKALGSVARILTFGGAKTQLTVKANGTEKHYAIESADSSIASIKQKN